MNRTHKPLQMAFASIAILVLSGCSLGQAANPTATPVDVNAVMTSAAATAFVQLTQIAGQASATLPPSETPATANTPSNGGLATQSGLQLLTPTEGAGGLPITPTELTGGTPGPGTGTPGAIPSLTPFAPTLAPGGNVQTCLNSKYIADVTIPDGTVMVPYQKFLKIWAIQNTGTCAWDQGFGYNIWAGPAMGGLPGKFSGHDQKVEPGGIFDVTIEMRAPPKKGSYIAHWKMESDSNQLFGADFVVSIIVQ